MIPRETLIEDDQEGESPERHRAMDKRRRATV